MQNINVLPLTQDRWPDLVSVFNAGGCSEARGCWCMFYRHNGKSGLPEGMTYSERNRAELMNLANADPPAGLIGYIDEKPVGWISLGPRADFLRLQHSPVMKPVDDKPVWSIVCFVVPSEYRHQGTAAGLLAGAIQFAKSRNVAILESYPVDKPGKLAENSIWFGMKSMYEKLGFVEVARRKPTRPVMRLYLSGNRD
jgi:GNAT superfamily N-acetyltransferase